MSADDDVMIRIRHEGGNTLSGTVAQVLETHLASGWSLDAGPEPRTRIATANAAVKVVVIPEDEPFDGPVLGRVAITTPPEHVAEVQAVLARALTGARTSHFPDRVHTLAGAILASPGALGHEVEVQPCADSDYVHVGLTVRAQLLAETVSAIERARR